MEPYEAMGDNQQLDILMAVENRGLISVYKLPCIKNLKTTLHH